LIWLRLTFCPFQPRLVRIGLWPKLVQLDLWSRPLGVDPPCPSCLEMRNKLTPLGMPKPVIILTENPQIYWVWVWLWRISDFFNWVRGWGWGCTYLPCPCPIPAIILIPVISMSQFKLLKYSLYIYIYIYIYIYWHTYTLYIFYFLFLFIVWFLMKLICISNIFHILSQPLCNYVQMMYVN